ncbi:Cof-type HAD-IIB family hydrolase [Carnobacterium pleistocenium]|uniref:Cof-type HAD-IIB family hydrolase n=1 Tax=Carnobacterium pleistocenium TaxID=181073 RepID=UPI0005508C21|nr:Cof-type HAD-IIB family hydrolase [Carnobacterium pleistocenium]
MEANYIFLDVDGTLVNYSNQLPNSAIKAIKSAQSNGHKVYPVTGRSKAEMYAEIVEIGFDGYIGGNGNYIESGNEVVLHQLMTIDQEKAIVDWLNNRGLAFYLESNNGLFASEHLETQGEQAVNDYVAYKENSGTKAMTVRQVFPEMIFAGQMYRDDVNKISFVLEEYDDYLAAVDFFSDFKVGTWGGVGEKALFGDIALANITKQTAIKKLLEHHGVDRKKTMAFGDAKIDIPMLEYCEIGVAMGNGDREIKAMADYITDSVDKDGLEKAFHHLGLIK